MTTYRYVGGGDYAPGVPARDLTTEEWAALSDEARAVAEALYQKSEVSSQTSEAEAEGEEQAGGGDGREDAGAVDDDPAGAADGGTGHRGVRGRRRGEAEGTT